MKSEIKDKLEDVFNEEKLGEIMEDAEVQIRDLVFEDIEKIIDVYQKEYIIPIVGRIYRKKSIVEQNAIFEVAEQILGANLKHFVDKIKGR